MTAEFAAKLAEYGIDYADAMDRFGDNASLYERLALKYLDDTHFVNMKAAIEVSDFDKAYSEAHSLKGVAGNLSLNDLYNAASEITEALRHGEYQAATYDLPVVEAAHEAARAGLMAWQESSL